MKFKPSKKWWDSNFGNTFDIENMSNTAEMLELLSASPEVFEKKYDFLNKKFKVSLTRGVDLLKESASNFPSNVKEELEALLAISITSVFYEKKEKLTKEMIDNAMIIIQTIKRSLIAAFELGKK